MRSITSNTYYGLVCLIGPWRCGWLGLLFIQFTQKSIKFVMVSVNIKATGELKLKECLMRAHFCHWLQMWPNFPAGWREWVSENPFDRGFINVFIRRPTCFHRWGENLSTIWSNWVYRIILTPSQFALCQALNEPRTFELLSNSTCKY